MRYGKWWKNMMTMIGETESCEDVKKKYWDDFVVTKDPHLFLEDSI